MILRCTGKVLKFLRADTRALVDAPSSPNDWYVNLVWLERRKCLLLTHAGTLFSVFIADVRKSDVESLQEFVSGHIHRALLHEELPPTTFGYLTAEQLELAKTADRRVLGCMNDMALYCMLGIEQEGGISSCDFDRINHELHRTFNSTTGYARPIELAREWGRADLDASLSGEDYFRNVRLTHRR